MNFGLEIFNSKGSRIFHTEDTPYRFTVQGGTPYVEGGFYRLKVPNFTRNAMVAMDARGTGFKGSVELGLIGGSLYAIPIIAGASVPYYAAVWSTPPKIYVIDTLKPISSQEVMGIKTYDSSGSLTFSSSTPLAKVISTRQVATGGSPAVVGPSNQLHFIHGNKAYTHFLPLGGGGQRRTWWYFLQQTDSGGFTRIQSMGRVQTISVDGNSDSTGPSPWTYMTTSVENPDD